MPAAMDLHGRSPVVPFSQKSSTQRPFKPLLACAVFAATVAGTLGALPARAAVGTLPGNFSVSASGAAMYSIPISLPRGSGGLTPQIALVYDSQSGTGMAGSGWTVSGFSTITRCNSAIYADGQAQAVQLTANDDYCLDGQRLRSTGGSYGAGGTYDTEIQGFSLITSYTSSSTNATVTGGPAYFTVQGKDGTTYEYGNTVDSQEFATGTSVVRVWALDKITDVNGNYISFTYAQDTTDGDYWPLSISYTGNGSTAPAHTVQFDWAQLPEVAVQASYVAGSLVSHTQLLNKIEVQYKGSDAFNYSLTYTTDAATSAQDLLYQVQECSGSGTSDCYPPTTINWKPRAAGWQADQATTQSVASPALAQAAHLMDVNGDGIMDLVYPNTVNGTTDWWVMFGVPGGGFSQPAVDTGIPAVNYSTALEINYNGDNMADLLFKASDNTWHVLQSTGGTSQGNIFNELPTNISDSAAVNFTVADLNGHGLGDIVYSDGSGLYAYINYGGTFTPPAGAPSNPVTLAAASSSTIRTVGAGTYTNSSQFTDTPMDFVGSGRGGHTALVGNTTSTTCNGDSGPGCEPTENTSWAFYGFWPTGTGSGLAFNSTAGISLGTQQGATPPSGWANPSPLNMKGDGLTDLLVEQTPLTSTAYEIFNIYFSTGNSFEGEFETLGVASSDPVFADYYGYGRQAMLVNEYQGGTGWTLVRLDYSLADHAFVPVSQSIAAPYPSTYEQGTLQVGDTSGYGLDDLVYLSQDSGGLYWHYRLHMPSAPTALVSGITDALGNDYDPTYVSLAASHAASGGIYTKGAATLATWPVVDESPALYVVNNYSFNDGVGTTPQPSVSYTYQGLQQNMEGYSQGFYLRSATDSRNGVVTTDTYDQSPFQYAGLLSSEGVTQSNGALISKVTYSPQNITTANGSQTLYYVYLGSSQYFTYDIANSTSASPVLVSTVTTNNNDFDGHGDVTDQVVETNDNFTNTHFTTETRTVYADSSSPYCISAPVKVTVIKTNPGGSPGSGTMQRITDGSTGFDDAHCRPTQMTYSAGTDSAANVTTGDGLSLTTAFGYDQWGNISQTTVSGTGIQGNHSSSVNYSAINGNAVSGEYPGTLTNALNQTTTEAWRSDIGFETSATDPNGQVTTYTPDDFGRLASVTHPDGSSASWVYGTCSSSCPTTGAYAITENVSNAGSTQTYSPLTTAYDSKGRVVSTLTTLLGGVKSNVSTSYDTLGRVTQVTNPHFGSSDAAITYYNDYDVLNRVRQILKPVKYDIKPSSDTDTADSVETDLTYYNPQYAPANTSGYVVQTKITDHYYQNTETTSQESNVLGQLAGVVDANNGVTQYFYDPFGDLASVTAADGLSTSLTYDGLGNKVQMTDPDMGTWTYAYDALGELLSQTDAKGQKVAQSYDSLGRLGSRTDYDSTGAQTVADTWTYDSAADGVGLPASVSDSNGYSKVFSYDSHGRPSALDTTIGGTDYQVSTTYDSFGRISTVSYPVSATPALPVASPVATPTQLVGGGTLTLDGSASSDPSGDPLTYAWTQTGGPSVTIPGPGAKITTVSLSQGGTYTFQLVVSDLNTSSAPATVSASVVVPQAPTNLTISPANSTTGSFTLSWTAPAGEISGYYFYESVNSGAFSQITPSGCGAAGVTTCALSRTNGSYQYYIVAYDSDGSGPDSNTATETVTLPPGAPTNLTVSANPSVTGNYTLNWTAPTSGTVTVYDVYQSTGGAYTEIGTTTAPTTSYALSGKVNGTYDYYVIACDTQAACFPTPSNTVTMQVTLPPAAPTLSITNTASPNTTGSYTVTWTAPTSGQYSYYELYQSENGGAYTPVTGDSDLSTTTTSVSFTGMGSLSANNTFSYKVSACDQGANACATSGAASVEVTMAPAAPGISISTSSNPNTTGSYTINWTAPPSGKYSYYELYQSVNGGTYTPVTGDTDLSTSTTSVSLTGMGSLSANNTYSYEVSACNQGSTACASSSAVSVEVTLAPAAPGISISTSSNPNTTGSYSVVWTAPSSGRYSYYALYQSVNGGSYTPVSGDTDLSASTTSVSFTGMGSLSANNTYSYEVSACNQVAAACTTSGSASVTVDLPPQAPTLSFNYLNNPTSTTISTGGTIPLVWTTPSGVVSYYNLERYDVNKAATSTPYSGSATSFSQTLSVVDVFEYSVQACNVGGSACGPWSDTATVQVESASGGCGKGCNNVIQPAQPLATPSGSTIAAPASGSGPVSLVTPVTRRQDEDGMPVPARELAVTSKLVAASQALARERAAFMPRSSQAPESLFEARALERQRAALPELLPVAPAADLAAWQISSAKRDPQGPMYAAPVYLAYGGAKLAPASGSSYRFTVQYQYDTSSGALTGVSNAGTGFIYWQAPMSGSAPVDGWGHLLAYTDGNNASTIMTYDSATGAVTGLSTGIGQSSAFQSLTYSWDGFGNLLKRQDTNQNLSENFTYDALNRLHTSAVTNPANNGPSLTVAYNAIGGITSRSDLGTFTYGDSNHPRAVTAVAGLPGTYVYDDNGNQTSGNNRTITWDVENHPLQITAPGGASTFSYGPGGERYQQVATSGGNTTTTTYVAGGLFEVVANSSTTEYRHMIMAGGQTVAVHSITAAGAVYTNYMHPDHLGSMDTITSDQGVVAQKMSFDSYGQRRDPTNWTYDLTQPQIASLTSITNKGYTAQEQLDDVGLVHMNGRVYDPQVGRMVSADPRVQDLMYTQAFNRYAYVFNNPLRYVDPSGYDGALPTSGYLQSLGLQQTVTQSLAYYQNQGQQAIQVAADTGAAIETTAGIVAFAFPGTEAPGAVAVADGVATFTGSAELDAALGNLSALGSTGLGGLSLASNLTGLTLDPPGSVTTALGTLDLGLVITAPLSPTTALVLISHLGDLVSKSLTPSKPVTPANPNAPSNPTPPNFGNNGSSPFNGASNSGLNTGGSITVPGGCNCEGGPDGPSNSSPGQPTIVIAPVNVTAPAPTAPTTPTTPTQPPPAPTVPCNSKGGDPCPP